MTRDNITIGAGLGGICLLSTRRQLRHAVYDAASLAGIERFVPPVPAVTTTLRSAMLEEGTRLYGRKRKQPITVRQLDEPNAFECVRVVPSTARNDYRFLFSASIDTQWRVNILDENFEVQSHALHEAVTQQVDLMRLYLPGPVISQVLVKGLRSWGAVSLKDDGGAWFLDGRFLEQYRAFAKHVRGTDGPKFTVTQFEIGSDPDTVAHVMELLRDEVTIGLSAIMQDVNEAHGGMTDRSINVRLDRANKFLAKVQQYESLFGRPITDLTDAIEQTKAAVAVNRLLATSV
jgi:hypothetical protein